MPSSPAGPPPAPPNAPTINCSSPNCATARVQRPNRRRRTMRRNAYVFERSVTFHHPDGTTQRGRIDLYKRGCFVLEAKQGIEKRDSRRRSLVRAPSKPLRAARKKGHRTARHARLGRGHAPARGQAEHYVRALPGHARPPALHHRRRRRPQHRALRRVQPQRRRLHPLPRPALPPHPARATARRRNPRALCAASGPTRWRSTPPPQRPRHPRDRRPSLAAWPSPWKEPATAPEVVAAFLMRCLFTMFAEDVGLLPKRSFTDLLERLRANAAPVRPACSTDLWRT